MYSRFYRMTKEPFHVTPNPEFLFLSPSHKEALASLIYGVSKGKGFIVIPGEVGVGKTTVLRSYLEKIDQRFHRIIYIFNPTFHSKDSSTPSTRSWIWSGTRMMRSRWYDLHRLMIEEYKQSRRLVLLIDEAPERLVRVTLAQAVSRATAWTRSSARRP